MSLVSHSSVLIIDGFDESREVLRTALQRRGLRVLEAAYASDGLAMARLHRPDIIVLDMETSSSSTTSTAEFALIAENDGGTLVILGNFQPSAGTAAGEFIAKPYHYKPLILRIEELLWRRCGRAAA